MVPVVRIALWAVLLSVAAEPLTAKVICLTTGRSRRSYNDGPWHYCFDGVYYTQKTAPPHVKEYFEKSASERNALMADAPAVAGSTRANPVGTVAASTKPVAKPLSQEVFLQITTGSDRDAVIKKLGPPHGSISNLGEEGTEESWTFLLTNGGQGKIRFNRGKVVSVNASN